MAAQIAGPARRVPATRYMQRPIAIRTIRTESILKRHVAQRYVKRASAASLKARVRATTRRKLPLKPSDVVAGRG